MAYYATAIDGRRLAILAGPCRRHGEALALVAPAHAYATIHAPTDAQWAGFGTIHVRTNHRRVGKLNRALGLELDGAGYVRQEPTP